MNNSEKMESATEMDHVTDRDATEADKKERMKRLSGKQKIIASVLAMAALTVFIGVRIYNMPGNRLSRLLDLGNTYLTEQNYEEAVLIFEQAIAIDARSMEAYAGGLEAYQHTGNADDRRVFYEKALEAVRGLDENLLSENINYALMIYLEANDIYKDRPEKVMEILEEGYRIIPENQELKDKLVSGYLIIAEKQMKSEACEDSLKVYDRLLELDDKDERIRKGLEECVRKYVDILLEEKKYDEIRKLAERYGEIIGGTYFSSLIAEIEELERIDAQNRAFMQSVYELMAAENYDEMFALFHSPEALAFVERITDGRYIYFPEDDGTLTGTGAGGYIDAWDDYYFYYGNYENGIRTGEGRLFSEGEYRDGDGYEVFSGEWRDDAPNGLGERWIMGYTMSNKTPFSSVMRSNFINGLMDGPVDYKVYTEHETSDLSFTAVLGVPQEDKTEEYYSSHSTVARKHDRIIAYDASTGVLQPYDAGGKYSVAGF